MYAKLNERVDSLLEALTPSQISDDAAVTKFLDEKFDKHEKFDYDALLKTKGDTLRKGLKDLTFDPAEFETTPPYNEMVEDLFVQIKEDHADAKDALKLVNYAKEHRARIDDLLSKQSIKLDDLLYQKSLLISSDDYHTGFDRSFLNKDEEERTPETKTVTSVETINSPGVTNTPPKKAEKTEKEVLEELQVMPETTEFSKIPLGDYVKSGAYLVKHPWICTEQQKDALIMTAFDHQLAGDSKAARQVIHQSLLLQYIAQLCGGGPNYNKDATVKAIKLFIGKINDPSVPVRTGFLQDYENTFNHIQNRCELIKQEQSQASDDDGEEGEALIQLRALDEGTELSVDIPPEGTPEYQLFTTELPLEMQEAVKTKSLDEVNKVFAKYKIEDAEQILEIINQCGVIGVSGYIEDEHEFEELQKQYNEQQIQEVEEEADDNADADSSVVHTETPNTEDIVD
ncbi:hypothetical protein CANTEDRAFT_120017 [Yamadazyma tenuis ATCC 10573]|nr:uncharacterized protein CANTEDRAFT_120017 [Yamadazyma tenuis ATCC 10573]EGV64500.1 hypothetical protein CANTEDRAFT_120017 [Yamadazyma tenuis ATCC 10573]